MIKIYWVLVEIKVEEDQDPVREIRKIIPYKGQGGLDIVNIAEKESMQKIFHNSTDYKLLKKELRKIVKT